MEGGNKGRDWGEGVFMAFSGKYFGYFTYFAYFGYFGSTPLHCTLLKYTTYTEVLESYS